MISKLIKRIFGKGKEDFAPVTNQKETENDNLFFDRVFILHESICCHQEIKMRRSTENCRITLGEILRDVFNIKQSSVLSMAVIRHSNFGHDIEMENIVENKEEIWNYDIFACILKYVLEDLTTLVLTCTDRNYIFTIVGLKRSKTTVFLRLTGFSPDNQDVDDCKSFDSQNEPIAISFVLSHCAKDNSQEVHKYKIIENSCNNKLKTKKELNVLEREYIHGKFEFEGFSYINYGKWLFEQNRYYDAYTNLERAFNYLRTHYEDATQDIMYSFYDVCNMLGFCLSKLGREEEAVYYFELGFARQSFEMANCFALSMARLGNPTAFDIAYQAYMNLKGIADKEYSVGYSMYNLIHPTTCVFTAFNIAYKWDEEKAKKFGEKRLEEIRTSCAKVTDVFNLYKNKFRAEVMPYNGKITIGYVLNALFGMHKKNLSMNMSIYSLPENVFLDRIEDIDEIENYRLNTDGAMDKVFTLTCSYAYYETDDQEDKSKLCTRVPLIISTHSIKGKETTSIMRVDIMRCNFPYDDDKREFIRLNIPLNMSFVLGNEDIKSYTTSIECLTKALRKAVSLIKENRFVEALKLSKWVLEYVFDKITDKEDETICEDLWDIFYESSYRTGFCLMELCKTNIAVYYLEIALGCRDMAFRNRNIEEYINCKVKLKDPNALNIIEGYMGIHPILKSKEEQDAWSYHMAFLKRRKAFVLIEMQKFDAAGEWLNDIINDPLCKGFAERELEYLNSLLEK